MKDLNIFIITWNCGRALVNPQVFSQYLFSAWETPGQTSAGDGSTFPDVVVLNLQEIAPISYAFIGSSWTRAYFDRFREAISLGVKHQQRLGNGEDEDVHYFNVVARNAGLTGIMVFVRDELVDKVKHLEVADVGVGTSDLGNKGAVGVRTGWDVDDQENKLMYTTFVSAHLAPFEEEVEKRNEDYKQIVANLVFTGEDMREWRKPNHNDQNVPVSTDGDKDKTMYSKDSHVFFAGDLNYRTALSKPSSDDFRRFPQPCKDVENPEHYSHLLPNDQLDQQHEAGKVLNGFTEQKIDFPPTYKYDHHEEREVWLDEDLDKWNWAAHRWPSWCDRIFYSTTSTPKPVAGRYISLPLFGTSDHRPVALSLSLPAAPVTNAELSKVTPRTLNKDWRSRRDVARRRELVVGIMSYLGLTWAGNGMVMATAMFILGGLWWSRGPA